MNRATWLEERKKCIGASDVAAVLRASPFKGPLDVYYDKIKEEAVESDNKWLCFGRDVEGAIANMYAMETGRPVDDLGATVIQKHSDYDFIGATLDRVTAENYGDPMTAPLELKHVSRFDMSALDWEIEPPLHYQIQLQTQMLVTGADWGSLAGMFPGYQLAYKDIGFSADFWEVALPVLAEFWDRVKTKNPPEVDRASNSLSVMKEIFKEQKEELISLPVECIEIVGKWEKAKHGARENKKNAEFYEAQLREVMQHSTSGQLPDGTFLRLTTTKRKGFTVEPTEFRSLRHSAKP